MEAVLRGPCKGCEKRTLGCHGKCREYKSAKTEYDKAVRAEKEAQHLNSILESIAVGRHKKPRREP